MATAIKGRGAVGAPPGRFDKTASEPFDDGWTRDDDAPPSETVIRWDSAKTILTENDSPDIPGELSANPYRGCEHGCVYCFARPSHAYLGLSPGLDFERKIFAKKDVVSHLRRELSRPKYRVRPLALGINTDAYQPVERRLKITRNMLEVLAECKHPVSLITKSALIERDLDILSEMARENLVDAAVSITSMDSDLTRKLEPRAAAPSRRLKVMSNLSAAGIPTTVLMAPIIPAVTDGEIESILSAAADAGACTAGYVVLRLPHELPEVFKQWLTEHMPERAAKVMSQVRAMHGGKDYDASFFSRHRGSGVFAELISRRFDAARRRYGLNPPRRTPLRCDLFSPPRESGRLF